MLQQCASRVVDRLYQSHTLDPSKRAIYQYGTELTLSTSAAVFSILLLAVLFGNWIWGALFLIVFFSLRLPGGGYHASTYRNCFLLTNSVFLISFGLSKLFLFSPTAVGAVFLLGSCVVIWVLAPIVNPRHPVSMQTYMKNKNTVRGIATIASVLVFFAEWVFSLHSLFCIYSASVAAVAVMMILTKFRGGTKNERDHQHHRSNH